MPRTCLRHQAVYGIRRQVTIRFLAIERNRIPNLLIKCLFEMQQDRAGNNVCPEGALENVVDNGDRRRMRALLVSGREFVLKGLLDLSMPVSQKLKHILKLIQAVLMMMVSVSLSLSGLAYVKPYMPD